MIPLFAELCAGTGALALRLEGGPRARPPVSRMGSKWGYGQVIFECLGVPAGSGARRYLFCEPDPGCRLLLYSYTDPGIREAAAEVIRRWSVEESDPRALWERLRAEGPLIAPTPREVARWIRIQSWEGLGKSSGGRFCDANAIGRPGWRAAPHDAPADRLDQIPTLPADITPDARRVDPRELARWLRIVGSNRMINIGPNWRNTGQGGSTFGGEAFCTPSGTLIEALTGNCPTLPALLCADARAVQPADLPPGSIAYIDPPYQGTTGYGNDLPRAEVCALAELWASAGALVVISEAEPIAELTGWSTVEITGERHGQKRTFSKQKREFLTMSAPPKWRPSVQRSLWSV